MTDDIPKPATILISGRRGSGKDVLAHQIARQLHAKTGKPVVVHFDPKPLYLPAYFHKYPGKVENDTIQLLTDSHLDLYAREWQGNYNKQIDKLQTISRHKNIDFIHTTQDPTRLDRNVVAGIDALIFREPSFMQDKMTRPEMRELTQEARREFAGKSQREKWKTAVAYTHTGKHVINDITMPYYWSNDLSKIYGAEQPEQPDEPALRLKYT